MLLADKAKIRFFSGSYCYYANLLCHENDNGVFTSDFAVF